MAKLPEQVNGKDLADNLRESLNGSNQPSVTVGVQRKANTGGFENIDIYCAITLPIGVNFEELNADIESAIQYGFQVTSTETLKRYNKVSIYGTESQAQEGTAQ